MVFPVWVVFPEGVTSDRFHCMINPVLGDHPNASQKVTQNRQSHIRGHQIFDTVCLHLYWDQIVSDYLQPIVLIIIIYTLRLSTLRTR